MIHKIKEKIRALLKKKVTSNFLVVVFTSLALKPIQFIREYFVTRYLGPADYGILKSLELIQMLDKFGSLGFKAVATREVGFQTGKKDQKQINELKGICYSAELLLSLFLFAVAIALALTLFQGPVSLMVILAGSGMLFSKIRGICNTELSILKDFKQISKVLLVSTVISNILVILLVEEFKIYAVLSLNAFTSLTAVIIYLRHLGTNFFRFTTKLRKFAPILKTGISLSLNTLSQGLYKYLERLLVLEFLGKVLLGFYGLAYMVNNQVFTLFKSLIKVRVQDIHTNLGAESYGIVHKLVYRESALSMLFSILLILPLYLLSGPAINRFLPEWTEAIPYVRMFLLMTPIQILPNHINIVLVSTVVNQQKAITIHRLSSSAILIGATYYLKETGGLNLESFMWINIVSYAYFSLALLALYVKYFYFLHVRSEQNSA